MKFCENSTFFYIWIFYFIKNKISRFWFRKKQFFKGQILKLRSKKNLGGGDKSSWTAFSPFLGYVSYIFPISAFLSKCTEGKQLRRNFHENHTQKRNFWRKLLRKSHKNQTQKNKLFGEQCCENRTFWKKKHFLIFARFL